MKASDKIVKNGTVNYSVRATARLLSTTANKIKEMMGRGDLEWTQFELNGKLFVTATSIAADDKRQKLPELINETTNLTSGCDSKICY